MLNIEGNLSNTSDRFKNKLLSNYKLKKLTENIIVY